MDFNFSLINGIKKNREFNVGLIKTFAVNGKRQKKLCD